MVDVVTRTFVEEVLRFVAGVTTVFAWDDSAAVFMATGTVSVDEVAGAEVV